MLARCILELLLKVGWNFGDFVFLCFVNVERILGYEIRCVCMGPVVLNSGLACARLGWPAHPSRTSWKDRFLIAQHHSICMPSLTF